MLSPPYIPRQEEQCILDEVASVRADRNSRVLLLYGPGGIGKTMLVRQLAVAHGGDEAITWVGPVDMDDSEYWLLSNLERLVANQLDPDNRYFGPYFDYLLRLPSLTRPGVSYDTVVTHLSEIKQVFTECYRRYAEESGKVVVIVLDTVEVLRGMYLLVTLTQWMKTLPATLFVLAGRPLPTHYDTDDPLRSELEDPHQGLPVTVVEVDRFDLRSAMAYIDNNDVALSLTDDEKEKVVHLTQGHPLWLAFAVDYLGNTGIPAEIDALALDEVVREIPYGGEPTLRGNSLCEAFKRRLVAPYHETDFWHEAIKRLAVVRESINVPTWQRLMADRPLPADIGSPDDAWRKLLRIPWIRQRANSRFVTLHDAVAEELARRIVPLHDERGEWRRQLWQRVADIYGEGAVRGRAALAEGLATLEEKLSALQPRRESDDGYTLAPEDTDTFFEAARLDSWKGEVAQLRTTELHYILLWDFENGTRRFLDLMTQAEAEHDFLFQDLLAYEMQRFLPDRSAEHVFGDVIAEAISQFRVWLAAPGNGLYIEVGLAMAAYFIKNEQPTAALMLLENLPVESAGADQCYRLSNLQGNACMRIPGRVGEGLMHFNQALDAASKLHSPERVRLIARAHKELGFYYRQTGRWQDADAAYLKARDAISSILSAGSALDEMEELASIQGNWAYVKGLIGEYSAGVSLVESSMAVRHRLGNTQEEGISWSICGEVHRYGRRFRRAWEAYAQAESIFQRHRNWAWLGVVYQEQAICLFQAFRDGDSLTSERHPIDSAKALILSALDLCRDLAIRSYPSALNRAGRIFGHEDPDAGLTYLVEGIRWANRLSDGWFLCANLIEYAELCYRAAAAYGRSEYIGQIADREGEVQRVIEDYNFAALAGRWELLQGRLAVDDWIETGVSARLTDALQCYKRGFPLVAQGGVRSGKTISDRFAGFRDTLMLLPAETRAAWLKALLHAWRSGTGETLLLARLEELY